MVRRLLPNSAASCRSENPSAARRAISEPTAAARETDLLETLRQEVRSPIWRARGLAQSLKALDAFEQAGIRESDQVAVRREPTLEEFVRVLGAADAADARAVEAMRRLVESPSAWRNATGEVRRAAMAHIQTRAQERAHAVFSTAPEILSRWFEG